MTAFFVVLFGWVLLFVTIGLFNTWYHGYGNPVEWWYRQINTDSSAGVWYYGSLPAARRRRRLT